MKDDTWDQEALFFTRRESRKEKKALSRKDRSKYKKSDQDQLKKKEERTPAQGEKQGRVTSMISQDIFVESEGKMFRCVLRGQLKKERGANKNLVVVGDLVSFTPVSEEEGAIEQVFERKTYLSRAENYSQKKQQLIAANIDQVFITVSVVNPPLRPSIIDRYLIAAASGGMEPIILINKIDLLEGHEQEKEVLDAVCAYYNAHVAPVLLISSETMEGIEQVKTAMQGKASVFSGQSGVGKSSIINAVLGTDLPVGETVKKTKKGAHTTTQASLLPLAEGDGWCIDTPGIKSFGLWEADSQMIRDHFHDFKAFAPLCRFPNCTHVHEPDCAVKEAAEEGQIEPLRYASYLALLEELETPHKSR